MPTESRGGRDKLAAVERRLRQFPGTVVLTIGLVGTFLLQIGVALSVGPDVVTWVFAAGPDPSPGWILAPLAHQGPQHLLFNLLIVLGYGLVVETLIGTRRQLGIFVGAGWVATAVMVITSRLTAFAGPAAGASGSAFAFVAFVTTITLVRADRQQVGHPIHVLGIAGIAILGIQLGTDLLVTGGTVWLAHVAGAVMGVAIGLWALSADAIPDIAGRSPVEEAA